LFRAEPDTKAGEEKIAFAHEDLRPAMEDSPEVMG
jgi:hypothetical protein